METIDVIILSGAGILLVLFIFWLIRNVLLRYWGIKEIIDNQKAIIELLKSLNEK